MCTHKIRGTVTEQTFSGCRKLDGTLHFPTAEETLQNYYCHLNSLKPLGRWREPATCIHEPCRAEPDYSSTPKDMNKNVDCSPPCTHTCRPGLAGSLSLSLSACLSHDHDWQVARRRVWSSRRCKLHHDRVHTRIARSVGWICSAAGAISSYH
jgi:hypothetical protein